jgi:thiol:disulfide interchange protein DsbA
MQKFLNFLAAAALAACVGGVGAATLQAGHDYEPVNPPQPTEAKGKIEVIEFFSYACPHCAQFEPLLARWVKALPKDVVFRRVPVTFGREQWSVLARTYYALEGMNAVERSHGAVFDAVHVERAIHMETAAKTESSMIDWLAGKGVDRKKFTDLYNSFTVQSQAGRAAQMTGSYGIQGVPSMVVAGKYRTPDGFEGGHEELLRLTDALIAKARSEQK